MSRPSRFLETVTSFFADQREERVAIIEAMNEPIIPGPTPRDLELEAEKERASELAEAGFGVVPDPQVVGTIGKIVLHPDVLNEGEMEELAGFRQVSRVPTATHYCCGGRLYAF